MKTSIRLVLIAAFGGLAVAAMAQAQVAASGVIHEVSDNGGGNFTYDIDLSDLATSGTTIGTFWYSWVPGQDYLPTAPSSASAPTGWQANIINGSGGSASIQFVANSSASYLQVGHSLDGFEFSINANPTSIFGDSNFNSHPPVGTSFVYQNGPFSGSSEKFVVTSQAVPEPTSLLALGCGALGLLFVKRRPN